jgi:hypothetical protein
MVNPATIFAMVITANTPLHSPLFPAVLVQILNNAAHKYPAASNILDNEAECVAPPRCSAITPGGM